MACSHSAAAQLLPDCQAALLPGCPPLLRLLLLLLVRGSASQLPCPPAPSCSLNPAFPAPLYLPSHYLPLLQVDTVDHIRWLFNSVKTLARRPQSAVQQGAPPPALITMCESGMGLLNLRCGTAVHAALLCGNSGGESNCCPCLPCRRTHRTCAACRAIFEAGLEQPGVLRLQACIVGADDYCASLAMRRQPGSDDTLFARRWVALHARAFGLQPIDQVMVSSSIQYAPGCWWHCCGLRACTRGAQPESAPHS